jgi:ADP-heptose:LPS heptosyltransferase
MYAPADLINKSRIIEGPYAVIHPFAATAEKTWKLGSFCKLAKFLSEALNLEPIIIGGPTDDMTPFGSFRTFANAPLGQIAQLMRDATIFVGNDSGPAHIAAAFGRPTVVIFGPFDHEIWAPWRTVSQVLKAEGAIETIPLNDVIAAVHQVLSQ